MASIGAHIRQLSIRSGTLYIAYPRLRLIEYDYRLLLLISCYITSCNWSFASLALLPWVSDLRIPDIWAPGIHFRIYGVYTYLDIHGYPVRNHPLGPIQAWDGPGHQTATGRHQIGMDPLTLMECSLFLAFSSSTLSGLFNLVQFLVMMNVIVCLNFEINKKRLETWLSE